MVPRYTVGDRRLVIGNRGLAGIDGSVSTAVGAALGRPRTSRAFALLGDVTFLHDINGLLIGPDEPRPDLTVVVVNDDGGSIFASLEQGGPELRRVLRDASSAPRTASTSPRSARPPGPRTGGSTRLDELRHALASPNGGIEVVEAVVRRDNRRDLDARIRALATWPALRKTDQARRPRGLVRMGAMSTAADHFTSFVDVAGARALDDHEADR